MKYEDCKVNMHVNHMYGGECTIVSLSPTSKTVMVRTKAGNVYNAMPVYLTPLNEIKKDEMSMLTFNKDKDYTLNYRPGAVYKFAGYMFEATNTNFSSVQLDTNGNVAGFLHPNSLSQPANSFDGQTMEEIKVKKYKVAYKTRDSEWLISENQYESIEAFIEYATALTITQAYLLK